MGKATGFLTYNRTQNREIEEKLRIQNYEEFHLLLDTEQRCEQAARCMNCGVPFCQSGVSFGGMVSGCPLHNLIPEWNDEIYHGNERQALERLRKQNNFPEFTGRVCPALCEAACTCGMKDTPVTIRDNELSIIEKGYEAGYMQPRIPRLRSGKKVAVIGAGPSGLTVADELNQRGHEVTVFEREKKPGGLLMYGIPNMKLQKDVIIRRQKLMEEEGIHFCTETDIGTTVLAAELEKQFDAIVLCCGAKKPRNVEAPGRDAAGIYYAVDYLSANTKALIGEDKVLQADLSAAGKDVVIVGGGDTGNDCVGTALRQGCKSVLQLEMMPKLPDQRTKTNPWPQWPRISKTDYGQKEAIAVFGQDPRVYETTIKEFLKNKKGNLIGIKTVGVSMLKDPQTGRNNMVEISDSEKKYSCQLLLIAAGFTGCEEYWMKDFQLEQAVRGTVPTGKDVYRTPREKVFTAGDAHRGQSLVVWAITEGRACAKEVDAYLVSNIR